MSTAFLNRHIGPTEADRRAILEILGQTKQGLPEYW